MNNKLLPGLVLVISITVIIMVFQLTGPNKENKNQKIEINQINNTMKYNYNIDTDKSIINWSAERIIGSKHTGTIKIQSGEINLTPEKIEGEMIIDMTTITDLDLSGDMKKKLEGHLKSADFFDVQNHPQAKFIITKSEKTEKNNFLITGLLMIKGIEHEITVPVTITQDGLTYKASANLEIDRTLWDIKYDSGKFFAIIGDKAIRDNINISANLYTASPKSVE